jgi:F0F1-type ATP synthase delta subunit
MLKNHRLLEAGQVLKALRDLNDSRQGILRVRVTVPARITEEEKKAIEDAIAARTGMKVKAQSTSTRSCSAASSPGPDPTSSTDRSRPQSGSSRSR